MAKIKSTHIGARYMEDRHYRTVANAVRSLIFNLIFVFFNGILGITTASLIFMTSAVYYLFLSSMRFSAVMLTRKGEPKYDRQAVVMIGILLIALSFFFHIMVILSMKYQTAAVRDTIPMLTIATYTFTKIVTAVVTAIRHKGGSARLYKAINAIRYSEVAVSLLTMQQSMLVSFGDGTDASSVILNGCTGAAVCIFIHILGILTLRCGRKEP